LSGIQCSEVLGTWKGYRVSSARRTRVRRRGAGTRVVIELVPEDRHTGVCSRCGRRVEAVHEVCLRWVRDLPILDAETHLKVHRRRLACPRCGPTLERLGWLERYSRVTVRMAESVARLCQCMPVKQVAGHYRLGWDQVKAIEKRWLQRRLDPPDLEGLEQLLVDEFALHKGQRYATSVVDAATKRVLWVGPGNSREALRPFFQLLGPERCACIRAVGMDMSAAYREEVRACCPQAEVVYDLFHVVARYGQLVVDRVRVDEANRLRSDPKARSVVKGTRWLLLRNRKSIRKQEDRVRLAELLKANQALATVYILKDDLKQLWRYKREYAARSFWESWYQRACESQLEPLVRFAENLKRHLPHILSHCRWALGTSVLEGINNRIKVIKRMGYGYRDEQYFFLKIRAAFPGIPG
jgi:transposase